MNPPEACMYCGSPRIGVAEGRAYFKCGSIAHHNRESLFNPEMYTWTKACPTNEAKLQTSL